MVGTGMTREKLEKMAAASRVGGVRRTHKAVRKSNSGEDSKLQQNLKKMGVSQIAEIEEVNLIMDNGTVVHFDHPRVQASIQSNTYVVSGNPSTKPIAEMLPTIIDQLGSESLAQLAQLKETLKETEKAESK
eukprot:Rhum_TRINITY_DN18474_c0_g1::Rhum_TRINITY_DN18474_c0_g1_i1::g.167282::m.167282/K01527/EGD1, BTF3; nascent polypeptide-associated complex subunit beta